MAQFRNLLKRCIPLLLALVVLISLFPAIPAFAAEASSSEGEISSTGGEISSGDAAVLSTYTLSGVWVFKSSLSYSSDISQSVNFTSNGNSYSMMRFSEVENPVFAHKLYYGALTVCTNNTFTNSAYKTVDFGTTPQTVSSIFYNWFTANATKQQTKTNYCVYVDGSLATSWIVADSSVELDLRVHEDSISVGFPEHDDEYYSVDYSGSPYLFGGMCKHDEIGCCDYMVSSSPYTITLSSSNPILYLTCAYKYPLYIDPNGGTWNGSSSVSVFWEFFNTDTDEIYDPVRPGYVFSGWSFSGGGEFSDAGDPPYIYEHGSSPGYLTANWVSEEVPAYTHTISIDGSSYTFTADNSSPAVQIQVLPAGISMTSGNTTKSWTYSGADTFVGIQDSSGNTYDVGASFSLLGSSGSDKTSVLTPLTQTPSQDTFTTLVKLYDSTGSTLLKSFLASSDAASPSATLSIGEKQLVFDSSALDSAITWNYTGDGTILGIALSANATSPSYTPGQTMTFGGVSNQGSVTSIYLITDSDSGNDFVIPAGQYEAKKAIMTGEYVALPSWPADLDSVPFAFKSSGLNYQSMSLGMYLPTSQAQLQYGSTAAYRYAGIDQSAGFTQDAYALVYLASDQAVPEAFYNWFTSAFTRISDELVRPTYSVTINIWNAAGTSVLRTVTYSGTLCPVATLQVTENGCIISCPGHDSIEWSTSGEFYGFRLYKVTTNAIYTPGNSYSLPGGAAADVVVDLFYADTASESQVQEVFQGVSSFLIQPVTMFFNIEFIPGLSFSRIALFAFVLGLVFWFLKSSK